MTAAAWPPLVAVLGAVVPLREQESAPVTQWGPRILLTLAVLAVVVVGLWAMRRGWRKPSFRFSTIRFRN